MLVINLFYCYLLISTVLGVNAQRSYELSIERLHKVMVDKQYVDLGSLRATRMNRTHTVISGEIQTKLPVDHTVLVTILTYEQSGTVYKRSAAIVYKNKPFCSFYDSEAIGVREFKAATNFPHKCPLPAGTYTVKNYILNADYFPAYIPASHWRGDFTVSQDDIEWCHVQIFIKIDPVVPHAPSTSHTPELG